MELSWLSALLGAFGLGVLKLIWEIVQFYTNRMDKIETNQQIFDTHQAELEILFNDLIKGAVYIQDQLVQFAVDNDIAKILVIKMENGGGIPQIGTDRHISILNEYTHPTSIHMLSMKHKFQHYKVDELYLKFIAGVLETGILDVLTIELDDGILKSVYESNGIVRSIILSISHIPELGKGQYNGFWIYMSIQLTTNQKLTPRVVSGYTILRDKIKQTFEEFYVDRMNDMM
tara:strand:+ start:452 stop:1144 length:693 start_codon:yes stop_codon:yes gene_type:complete